MGALSRVAIFLAATNMAVSCGGKGSLGLHAPDAAVASHGGALGSGTGGNGGGGGGTGGAQAPSGTGGLTSVTTTPDAAVASADGAGATSPDASCNWGYLWDAISSAAGVIGYCNPIATWDNGTILWGGDAGYFWGYVVIDGTGRVVDNSYLFGERKQAWLDGLSNKRFACVAGYTIGYTCFSE